MFIIIIIIIIIIIWTLNTEFIILFEFIWK